MSIRYNSYKCQESEELPPIISCHNSSDSNTISPKSIYGTYASYPYSREVFKSEASPLQNNHNKAVPGLNYILSHLGDHPSRSPSLPPPVSYYSHSNTAPESPDSNGILSQKNKPVVGSKEWVHLRRENHKAVERKRRDCINDNINLLGELVPGPEKNKGGILSRVVAHIQGLREANSHLKENHEKKSQQLHSTIQELSRTLRDLEEENLYLKSRVMKSSSTNRS